MADLVLRLGIDVYVVISSIQPTPPHHNIYIYPPTTAKLHTPTRTYTGINNHVGMAEKDALVGGHNEMGEGEPPDPFQSR